MPLRCSCLAHCILCACLWKRTLLGEASYWRVLPPAPNLRCTFFPACTPHSNAVICATGPTDRLNPLGPFTVDCEGTKNLVAAAQQQVSFCLASHLYCWLRVDCEGTKNLVAAAQQQVGRGGCPEGM